MTTLLPTARPRSLLWAPLHGGLTLPDCPMVSSFTFFNLHLPY